MTNPVPAGPGGTGPAPAAPAAPAAPPAPPAPAAPAALADPADPADAAYEAGMAVRRAVLGDAHVDRAVAGTTGFTEAFQDLITRYAWGSVWSRPGLDRRTRSCVTLALLTALRCEDELAMHVRAAVRNGLSADEISEVILHTAVYAGVPAANSAYAVAQRVLAGTSADTSAEAERTATDGPDPEETR